MSRENKNGETKTAELIPTPSQTVGPFFHLGCTENHAVTCISTANAKGERVHLICRVFDGNGLRWTRQFEHAALRRAHASGFLRGDAEPPLQARQHARKALALLFAFRRFDRLLRERESSLETVAALEHPHAPMTRPGPAAAAINGQRHFPLLLALAMLSDAKQQLHATRFKPRVADLDSGDFVQQWVDRLTHCQRLERFAASVQGEIAVHIRTPLKRPR